MMCAYDRSYLEKAQISLGRMLDYAVYDLKYDIAAFWDLFLSSDVSVQFASGDVSVLAGRSGTELALMVTGRENNYTKPSFSEGKSEEYWLGWALAYYQWKTDLAFSQITDFITINELLLMYSPYHEMDVRQFCDKVSEIYAIRKQQTNLKRRRLQAGLSQSQLALLSGIPVRTLQQYEQRQKNINRARVDYIISLAHVLSCSPQLLLELESD